MNFKNITYTALKCNQVQWILNHYHRENNRYHHRRRHHHCDRRHHAFHNHMALQSNFVIRYSISLDGCIRLSPCALTFTWWGCCSVCPGHKPTELNHSFLFCSCVYFCLYGPFNCTSFHKLSRQLSAISLCSAGLISTLLVFPTIYISL